MRFFFRFLYLLLINVFTFSGCSEHSPVQPSNDRPISQINILKRSGTIPSLNKIVSVDQLINASEGGSLNLEVGSDVYLLDIIQNSDGVKLKDEIITYSPVSPSVLTALLKMPNPISSGDTKKVLIKNSPLRTCILNDFMESAPSFVSTGDMKAVLLESSPLPPEILDRVDDLGLSSGDLSTVLEAQVGTRLNDSDLNVGTNGVRVNLQILPGGISEDTRMSISMEDEQIAGDVHVTFGPHGTVFNPPAVLNVEVTGLDLSGINPAGIDVYYINPQTGLWELMQRDDILVRQNEGYVKVVNAFLPHFSRYSIGME